MDPLSLLIGFTLGVVAGAVAVWAYYLKKYAR